ncbi:MAG: hypothetical protein AAF391_08425, partial [Bacteroidota bacterium]
MRVFNIILFFLAFSLVQAQKKSASLSDCLREKDLVFIDWIDKLNHKYAGKEEIQRLSKKKM